MEPNRTEWQKRCTFNGFCKKVLKNEAIDAIRENRTRRKHEVVFSELTPQEESQLYTYDHYFEEQEGFQVAGKWITAKLLADALHMPLTGLKKLPGLARQLPFPQGNGLYIPPE